MIRARSCDAAGAQVLDRGADVLQRDAGVQQPLDHLEHEDVAERVQPLGARAGGGADARHHQPGAGPVVELAVGDAGGVARGRPAVADQSSSRRRRRRPSVNSMLLTARRRARRGRSRGRPPRRSTRHSAAGGDVVPRRKLHGGRFGRYGGRAPSPGQRTSPGVSLDVNQQAETRLPGEVLRARSVSRNSRNFSTSSSCSSGMTMPASASTGLRAEDRRAGPQRQRDRVDGPGADPDAAGEDQLGVEDAVAQLGDVHGLAAGRRARRARPGAGRG